MKLLIQIVFLFTSTILTSTILASTLTDLQSKLPQCSLECLVSGAAEHGCSAQDVTCMCTKIEPMIKTVSPCLVKAGCHLEDITDTAKVVFQICEEVKGSMNVTNVNSTASTTPAVATPSLTAAAGHLTQNLLPWTGVAAAAIAAVLL